MTVVDQSGPVLSVRDLGIRTTSGTPLVTDISFEVAPRERVGLIGESGSGKSITSQAAFGLLPDGLHASGSIHLASSPIDMVGAADNQVRRLRGTSVSMVFQEPMTALNPTMRVGKQVAEAISIHNPGLSRNQLNARVVELLEEVRLPNPAATAKAYPHQLSGGQRQRVVIAMALANAPSLIICDEPTTALDVTVQAQILELIGDVIERHGSSLLFITHDLAVVASLCQRVLVMLDGKIVESGAVPDVFTNPQHEYTKGLIAASDLTVTDEEGRLHTVATSRDAKTATVQTASRQPTSAATDPSAEPAVVIENVSRTFGKPRSTFNRTGRVVQATKDINLTIGRGERFGIVGESGSGKTTLIKMVAGLDQPTSGSIRVDGEEIVGRSERELGFLRKKVQFVFQDPMGSLDPRMTVRQIIVEPLLSIDHPDHAGRVAELLDAVDLPASAADRYPHQFSGGQRQRISIARALAPNPSILIADEPVSALDVSVRAQVLNLLNDLVDEYQLTMLFVSHDLAVVKHLCDRVAVMYHGDLIEVAATADIYSDRAQPYTKQLLVASSTLREVLDGREFVLVP